MLRLRFLDLIKSCDHYLQRGGEVSRAARPGPQITALHQGQPWRARGEESSSTASDLFTCRGEHFEWPLTELTSRLFVQRNLDHSGWVTGKLQWTSQYAVITVDVAMMRCGHHN